MTQIKLRRDTAANFTSKNPVLGIGEPAYETDTKKLKIGDGTTAYTQLEYFSAGGGGSTNISATLPLKIVDGVISLEVDGQTIQIVDGKLHANLDELGNEVNNLSGRVTAVEADIANKEDELTPVAPITINKYVKSNLHGFSFTTDGTGVYATSGKSLSYRDFDSQSQGKMIFQNNTVISSADESWACYIDVPISLGQVVKFPVPDANTYGYPMCILGKTDATGHFTVITHGYTLSYMRCNPTDDALVFDGDYVYTKNVLNYSGTSSHTDTVNNQDPYTGFVQLFENEVGTFSIQIHKCSGASNNIPYYSTHKYVISDVSAINRFKEINTVRIVPFYYGTKNGKTADSAISVNSIGLYNCSTDLFSLNNDMSQFDTGNLFDIAGETAHNYLELNIGSGLAITDGKLTASSTAPTNMVTTDTEQTITGQKNFANPITLNSVIKFNTCPALIKGDKSTLDIILGAYDDRLMIGSQNTRPIKLNSDSITDYNGNNLLSYANIVQGDNITIEKTSTGVKISSIGGSSAPPAQPLEQLDLNYVGTAGTYLYNGWSASPPKHTPISGINDSFFLEIISNNGAGPDNRTLQRLTYNHESSHKGASYFRTGMQGYDSSWTSWVQITPAITS